MTFPCGAQPLLPLLLQQLLPLRPGIFQVSRMPGLGILKKGVSPHYQRAEMEVFSLGARVEGALAH